MFQSIRLLLSKITVMTILLMVGCQSDTTNDPNVVVEGTALPLITQPPTTIPVETTPSEEIENSEAEPETNLSESDYTSGGLGLDRAQWEGIYGDGGSAPMALYESGGAENTYAVLFDSATDRATRIYLYFGNRLLESEAITAGEALIPTDSALIDTYTFEKASFHVVRVYFSESLAQRFDVEQFEGAAPGTFIISYSFVEEESESLMLAIGNNP